MLRHWWLLRRIRQRASLRSEERGAVEVYLRQRGMFEAPVHVGWSWLRSAVVAASLIVIACVSVGSYAYASDNVLPDTPLYPVREVIERVEVQFAVTPVQKKQVVQKLVERREQEVRKLTELKRPVPASLKKFIREERKEAKERFKEEVRATTLQRVRERQEARQKEREAKGVQRNEQTRQREDRIKQSFPSQRLERERQQREQVRLQRREQRQRQRGERLELPKKNLQDVE